MDYKHLPVPLCVSYKAECYKTLTLRIPIFAYLECSKFAGINNTEKHAYT